MANSGSFTRYRWCRYAREWPMVSSVGSIGPKSRLYLPCPMCIVPARVLKVPCRARAGSGSLEAGSWRWDWKLRKYKVAESTHGDFASWLLPLARPSDPFRPSGFHARGAGMKGVQDMLLVDRRDAALEALPRLKQVRALGPDPGTRLAPLQPCSVHQMSSSWSI